MYMQPGLLQQSWRGQRANFDVCHSHDLFMYCLFRQSEHSFQVLSCQASSLCIYIQLNLDSSSTDSLSTSYSQQHQLTRYYSFCHFALISLLLGPFLQVRIIQSVNSISTSQNHLGPVLLNKLHVRTPLALVVFFSNTFIVK